MSAHYHVAVWIDHHEAKIVLFNAAEAQDVVIYSPHRNDHLHSKAGSASGTHRRADDNFFKDVAHAVASARAILLTGPSDAKVEFVKYLERHAPEIGPRISVVETSGTMSPGQLAAHARDHFKLADRISSQMGH